MGKGGADDNVANRASPLEGAYRVRIGCVSDASPAASHADTNRTNWFVCARPCRGWRLVQSCLEWNRFHIACTTARAVPAATDSSRWTAMTGRGWSSSCALC